MSLSEFQEVAQEMLTPCTSPYLLNSQTYQIFRRYDRDCDGYLSFNEFSDFLLPTADLRVAGNIQIRRDAKVSPDALELIKRLIKSHITINGSQEFLRARLRRQLES